MYRYNRKVKQQELASILQPVAEGPPSLAQKTHMGILDGSSAEEHHFVHPENTYVVETH